MPKKQRTVEHGRLPKPPPEYAAQRWRGTTSSVRPSQTAWNGPLRRASIYSWRVHGVRGRRPRRHGAVVLAHERDFQPACSEAQQVEQRKPAPPMSPDRAERAHDPTSSPHDGPSTKKKPKTDLHPRQNSHPSQVDCCGRISTRSNCLVPVRRCFQKPVTYL